MAFLENIFDYLTDKSKHLSKRATIFILSVVVIILFDNITGFSYYYNKARQLEQFKSITGLLKDSTIDIESKKKLLILKKETFHRKNVIDHSLSFIQSLSFQSSSDNSKLKQGKQRNNFWFLASASGLYILTALILIPVLLTTNKKIPFFQMLAMLLIFSVVIFFTSWFNYWLFGTIIPDEIFGSWTWNYIVNFLLQTILIIGLIWTTSRIEKFSNN